MEGRYNINELSNTYGWVELARNDQGCFLELPDHSTVSSVKISNELFQLMKEELELIKHS